MLVSPTVAALQFQSFAQVQKDHYSQPFDGLSMAASGSPVGPQSVDKGCRRSHGWVERLAMDGPLVSRYLTLVGLGGSV
ncbi:MAG: hypothetical protein DMG13_06745 [Acidobacteria bacterium]|nr:MAG: hypothetical protein DMG13_06745 [Acidobacteriota bacterium]